MSERKKTERAKKRRAERTEALTRDPKFAISIPERAVRQVLGTAGHTARELTLVLVPPAVRGTRFWNAAIERSLTILAEGVGHVRSGAEKPADVDVARLAVGSVVDTAALLVFHVSPLWLLAIVNDVAKGSREYLDEVVLELRARGVLEAGVKIDGVDHLLSVLERASGRLQSEVDKPPLSVAELRRSVDEIRETLADAPRDKVAADAAKLAKELKETCQAEGRTLREISNAVAVELASRARFAGQAAKAGVGVASRLLVVKGWRPYVEQLRAVRKLGFSRYLADAASPIADALTTNFDPRTDTLTARLVSGATWKNALARLRGK